MKREASGPLRVAPMWAAWKRLQGRSKISVRRGAAEFEIFSSRERASAKAIGNGMDGGAVAGKDGTSGWRSGTVRLQESDALAEG